MKHMIIACMAAVTLGASVIADDAAWTTLFDGKTLANWNKPFEWGEATVKGGEIMTYKVLTQNA